jgi:hypothetical protein
MAATNIKDNVTSTSSATSTTTLSSSTASAAVSQEMAWSRMTNPTTSGTHHLSPSLSSSRLPAARILLTGNRMMGDSSGGGHSTTIKSLSSSSSSSRASSFAPYFRVESQNTRETITEVKRSADEFEFQMEPPDPPVSLASSSSSRVTGPYFESNKTIVHLTARAGQTVLFDCTVVLLQGRTVSRRRTFWFKT